MNTQVKSPLFHDLSAQSASQAKGGSWGYSRLTIRIVVPRAVVSSRTVTTPISASSVNISNLDIDDGAIVTLPSAANVTITNPDIDDGAIVSF